MNADLSDAAAAAERVASPPANAADAAAGPRSGAGEDLVQAQLDELAATITTMQTTIATQARQILDLQRETRMLKATEDGEPQ